LHRCHHPLVPYPSAYVRARVLVRARAGARARTHRLRVRVHAQRSAAEKRATQGRAERRTRSLVDIYEERIHDPVRPSALRKGCLAQVSAQLVILPLRPRHKCKFKSARMLLLIVPLYRLQAVSWPLRLLSCVPLRLLSCVLVPAPLKLCPGPWAS
jgi:hypothetical protein